MQRSRPTYLARDQLDHRERCQIEPNKVTARRRASLRPADTGKRAQAQATPEAGTLAQ